MIDLGILSVTPVGRAWKPHKKTDALGSRVALTLSCGCHGHWIRVSRQTRWYFDPFEARLGICRTHGHPKLTKSPRKKPAPAVTAQ